jgi:hypothetical protein
MEFGRTFVVLLLLVVSLGGSQGLYGHGCPALQQPLSYGVRTVDVHQKLHRQQGCYTAAVVAVSCQHTWSRDMHCVRCYMAASCKLNQRRGLIAHCVHQWSIAGQLGWCRRSAFKVPCSQLEAAKKVWWSALEWPLPVSGVQLPVK